MLKNLEIFVEEYDRTSVEVFCVVLGYLTPQIVNLKRGSIFLRAEWKKEMYSCLYVYRSICACRGYIGMVLAGVCFNASFCFALQVVVSIQALVLTKVGGRDKDFNRVCSLHLVSSIAIYFSTETYVYNLSFLCRTPSSTRLDSSGNVPNLRCV